MAGQRSKDDYQQEISALKERRSELVNDPDAKVSALREVEAQIKALRDEQIAAYPEMLEPVKS